MRNGIACAACVAIAIGVAIWMDRHKRRDTGARTRGGWVPADGPLGKVLE
jgi:hypothetical protein